MAGRYEIFDQGWALIEDIVLILPSTRGHRSKRSFDPRRPLG